MSHSRLAELKKENGNQLYKIKQYRSAIPLYTEAIHLCPDQPSYYSNRSACYMMINNFQEALEDARKSVQLDPTFVKGYVRCLKCGIALGDLMTAENAAKRIKELDPKGTNINNELQSLQILKQYEAEAQKAYEKKDFRKGKSQFKRLYVSNYWVFIILYILWSLVWTFLCVSGKFNRQLLNGL